MVDPLYLIALAPVPLTLRVGLAAVFVTVNFIVILAPVSNTNPVQDTTLAAVAAAVEQDPK